DDGQGVEGESPEVVDPAADSRRAVGVVPGHQRSGQPQGRGGVVVGAAAQAGPPAPVGLVVGQGTRVHAGGGGRHVGQAAAQAGAPAAPLGQVVVDPAAAYGNDADAQVPIDGGVEFRQVIEDGAARPQAGEDGPAAAGRIAVSPAGLVVVENTGAEGECTSHLVGNACPDARADQTRHGGGTAVVVAADRIVVGEDAVGDGEGVGAEEVSA